MQSVAAAMVVMWSVLVPGRQWVPPGMPLEVTVKYAGANLPALTLLLADFTGSTVAPTRSADVKDGQTVDIKSLYPSLNKPGTYLLFAVPRREDPTTLSAANFVGTPVIIGVREDRRIGAPSGAMVYRLQPLQYAVMS